MKIDKQLNDASLTVSLEGRLDTTTAPELESDLHNLEGITHLILDFSKLDYISSAGLRVLLSAYKTMQKQGDMKIVHANDLVQKVFDVTGFSDILTIE